ncbi:MAG TPA: hypothetical protein VI731_02285 [Bacteroidia bacterium]|nr:hypothetical protein [Bacteroidia bacterium]
MKKSFLFFFAALFSQQIFSQQPVYPEKASSTDFYLHILDEEMQIERTGNFVPGLVQPAKKKIKRSDPGASGHFTLLIKNNILIRGGTDTLDKLLNQSGNFLFLFQNTDLLDSSKYLTLVADSVDQAHFIARVNKIRKRDWELYRLVLHPRGTDLYYTFYLRYLKNIFTASLPKKGSRENFAVKSISPAIPVIHLGILDDPNRQFGPGLSFSLGLVPVRPFRRLVADIIGPISIEWMFKPVATLEEALAIRSLAVGLFFNSFYGIFHWGIAWYEPLYCRAEAYIGINLVPVMQLLQGGKTQRYRW